MLKKILSPIVYVAFFALTLINIFGLNYLIAETITGSSFGWQMITLFILILTIGTFFYWFGSYIMVKLEKLHKPKIADHFRQSIIYYLIVFYLLIIHLPFRMPHVQDAVGVRYTPFEYYLYLILLVLISIWAIFVNGIFLYKRNKENIS